MIKSTLLVSALLLALAGSADADGVTYDVTVNTSSIAGTSGSLDFQFNPGPLATQAANLQIQSFMPGGGVGTAVSTGDVTGALPGTITFDNGSGYNDYFTGFTYGSTLSFLVNLYGPAVSTPDGVSTSGSMFSFSMFSDPGGTMPVLTSDTTDGYAFTVAINLDGSTTPTNYSSELTATPVNAVATPEPGTLLLFVLGLAGFALLRKQQSACC